MLFQISCGFVLQDLLSTDGSAVIYQPYLVSPVFPVQRVADLKFFLDTDKPGN